MASPSSTIRSAPRAHPGAAITQSVAVRQHNLSLVLSVVAHASGPLSRAEIAQRTDVTRATASAIVDQLVAAGLLEELDPIYSGRAGRPAVPVRLAHGTVAGLGLEVDVDFLGVRALDLAGQTLGESIIERDLRGSDPVATLGELGSVAARLAKQLMADGVRLAGSVLALPGIADAPLGPLRLAPNLRWRQVDVVAALADQPFALLSIANEANLAARAELAALPSGQSADRSFLYLSGGYGIGGTVVLDGQTLSGAHNWAGEVGHVTVDPAGPNCTCGSTGCLETYIGRRALMRQAGLEPSRPVSDLVSALLQGQDLALRTMLSAGRALGVALGSALNLIDLSRVVFGGFHGPLVPYLAPSVLGELKNRAMSTRLTDTAPQFLPPAAGPRPALTGAALTALDRLFADPTAHLPGSTGRE